MSDQSVAAIARSLAEALAARGHSRSAEDQKLVAALQTELVSECRAELIEASQVLE
jgi:hypothetical protein